MAPAVAELDPRVREIATWFKTTYLGKEGFPVWTIRGAGAGGIGTAHLLTELGDYLPFLLVKGERPFVEQQLNLARRAFERRPMIMSTYGQRPGPLGSWRRPLRWTPHVDSFDYSDLLLGLLRCCEWGADGATLACARSVWAYVRSLFWRQDFLCSWYLPALRRPFPQMTEAHSGVYIELLVDLYALTQERQYLEQAARLAHAWSELDYFQAHAVFPHVHFLSGSYARLPGLARLGQRAVLFKHNTHLVAGILALYEATRDPGLKEILDRWVRGFSETFLGNRGEVYQRVSFEGATLARSGILYTGFAACDLLCDMAWVTREDRLVALAERLADWWLSEQSPSTGLFPTAHGSSQSFLDGVTDLGVTLVKLSCLTRDPRYREAAMRALEGIVRFHHSPLGYVNAVDIASGAVLDGTIETRYVALLLKLFIAMDEPGNLYENAALVKLLRDR